MDGNLKLQDTIKHAFACVRCSQRKVKCDRQNPCSSCRRQSADCVFRAPKPSKRRRISAGDQELRLRLERYEELLKSRGIDPSSATTIEGSSESSRDPTDGVNDHEDCYHAGLVVPTETDGTQTTSFAPAILENGGGTKMVDNMLWSRVAEEIHQTVTQGQTDDTSDDDNQEYAHVFGQEITNLSLSHPSPNQIRYLWDAFVQNVNPLTKLIHVPSLQPAMEKAIRDVQKVPKGFEALMFSIYNMAVLSLQESQCQEMLDDSRASLLCLYESATRVALSRAKFMSCTSIIVMQAIVLHILATRDSHDSRAVWSFTGLATRIAENMGMRVDGELLGLSPFETEIRRRIWWQLKMHDSRSAELCGQAKFRDFNMDDSTPKPPANVDDDKLSPSMKEPPRETSRPTSMFWIVLRSELATFAVSQMKKLRQSGSSSEEFAAMDNMKHKDDMICQIEDMLESRFLRFCDPSQPLHLLVLLAGRSAIDLIRFIAHHPRRWSKMKHIPTSERDLVWNLVMQLLERNDALQSNPQLRHFAWNVPYYIQWHAVIHVLDTLATNPFHTEAVRAWRLIHNIFEHNASLLLDTRKPLYLAVDNLCLKAHNVRAKALADNGIATEPVPQYILKLREQRNAGKSKSGLKLPSQSSRKTSDEPGQGLTTSASLTVSSPGAQTRASIDEHAYGAQVHQIEDDMYWLGNNLPNDMLSNVSHMMDFDPSLIAESWQEDLSQTAVDWSQWDTWMM